MEKLEINFSLFNSVSEIENTKSYNIYYSICNDYTGKTEAFTKNNNKCHNYISIDFTNHNEVVNEYKKLIEKPQNISNNKILVENILLIFFDKDFNEQFTLSSYYLLKKNPDLIIIFISQKSIMFHLKSKNEIWLNPNIFSLKGIGLIPLDKNTQITTNGLEWELDNTNTHIGGELISSSNQVKNLNGFPINHKQISTNNSKETVIITELNQKDEIVRHKDLDLSSLDKLYRISVFVNNGSAIFTAGLAKGLLD